MRRPLRGSAARVRGSLASSLCSDRVVTRARGGLVGSGRSPPGALAGTPLFTPCVRARPQAVLPGFSECPDAHEALPPALLLPPPEHEAAQGRASSCRLGKGPAASGGARPSSRVRASPSRPGLSSCWRPHVSGGGAGAVDWWHGAETRTVQREGIMLGAAAPRACLCPAVLSAPAFPEVPCPPHSGQGRSQGTQLSNSGSSSTRYPLFGIQTRLGLSVTTSQSLPWA